MNTNPIKTTFNCLNYLSIETVIGLTAIQTVALKAFPNKKILSMTALNITISGISIALGLRLEKIAVSVALASFAALGIHKLLEIKKKSNQSQLMCFHTTKQLITDCYRENQGLWIGIVKDDTLGIQAILKNMDTLKAMGVSSIFIPSFPTEGPFEIDIITYIPKAEDEFKTDTREFLDSHPSAKKPNYLDLIKEAKKKQIYLFSTHGEAYPNHSHSDWIKNVLHNDPTLKYLIIEEFASSKFQNKEIQLLANALKIPSYFIVNKKDIKIEGVTGVIHP